MGFLKNLIYKTVLRAGNWQVVNGLNKPVKKAILVAAPHTSNWDFVYAIPTLHALGVKNQRYLIKKELFIWPLSWLFKVTGGIPVDRSKKNDLTSTLKKLLDENESLFLLFPPEGTRSRVERWKTGFYYTAIDTGLPIILAFIDGENRRIGFGDIIYPSGDFNQDFERIESFYEDIKGIIPKNYNPKIYLPKDEV